MCKLWNVVNLNLNKLIQLTTLVEANVPCEPMLCGQPMALVSNRVAQELLLEPTRLRSLRQIEIDNRGRLLAVQAPPSNRSCQPYHMPFFKTWNILNSFFDNGKVIAQDKKKYVQFPELYGENLNLLNISQQANR